MRACKCVRAVASRVPVRAALSTTWVIALFALPIVAIIVIVAFALYHSSEVQQDGRDDDNWKGDD